MKNFKQEDHIRYLEIDKEAQKIERSLFNALEVLVNIIAIELGIYYTAYLKNGYISKID